MLKIFEYVTNDGKCPFRYWLDNLRDIRAKARISTQLDRLALGNFGDSKAVGKGVIEIRLSYGPDGESLVYYSVVEIKAPRRMTSQKRKLYG